MPEARHIPFATTLVAVPVWFGVLMSRANEVNPAGVIVYGLLLLVLAPASAFAASRYLGPYALRASRPLRAPWAGLALATLCFAVILGAWYAYSLRLSHGGGSALGVMAWYLTLMLVPPVYGGCLAHLLADAVARRPTAG